MTPLRRFRLRVSKSGVCDSDCFWDRAGPLKSEKNPEPHSLAWLRSMRLRLKGRANSIDRRGTQGETRSACRRSANDNFMLRSPTPSSNSSRVSNRRGTRVGCRRGLVLGAKSRSSHYAVEPFSTTEVQKAHRRAAIGIALRHSGQFLVVGSGGAPPRRNRAMIVLNGRTTKK